MLSLTNNILTNFLHTNVSLLYYPTIKMTLNVKNCEVLTQWDLVTHGPTLLILLPWNQQNNIGINPMCLRSPWAESPKVISFYQVKKMVGITTMDLGALIPTILIILPCSQFKIFSLLPEGKTILIIFLFREFKKYEGLTLWTLVPLEGRLSTTTNHINVRYYLQIYCR